MARPNPTNLTIVGCGPGGEEYITLAGMRAIEKARVLIGSRRLLETFGSPAVEQVAVGGDIEAALEAIECRCIEGGVVVLVSGDPGISSLAQPVIRRFGCHRCTVIPGISAIQVAFARLGVQWLDARLITAHGRVPDAMADELAACPKIAVLAGTVQAMQWAADLAAALPGHQVFVCCDLTLAEESVRAVRAAELRGAPFSARTMILYLKEGVY